MIINNKSKELIEKLKENEPVGSFGYNGAIDGFDRINGLVNELESVKYFRGNETPDVSYTIGQILHKYLTEDDDIDNFIFGLKRGIQSQTDKNFYI